MLRFRSVSVSVSSIFLPTVFLVFSTFFFCSTTSREVVTTQSHPFQFKPIQGLFGGEEDWRVGHRRFIAEGSGTDGSVNNPSLILAAERTKRRDPLNDFNSYTGGWNISERHYWASVGFTAVPLFIVALVWFAIFGLSLLLICCCYCCCRREPYGYSRTAYALSLIFLILFTISAIIGCIVLYTGQGKFNASTEDTLEYVVKQANLTADNLRNVSGYLAAAKDIKVATVLLGPDVQTSIDEIDSKINSSATTVADKTEKNSNTIEEVLHDVRLSLIILAAVMLLLTFLGFLFSILGMQSLVSILVVIGWILVTGTFILCGVFLLLHNVVADTCVAMDQWVQNPTAHTALDDILPCVDNATANETLIRSKQVSFQLVNVVNQVINTTSNANIPSFLGPPLYINQSGPLVPVLCNPFNTDLTGRECRTGEVAFNNATQIWKNYVCQVSSSGVCTTVGRLTPDFYNQMAAAVNVSFGLYHYGPFLVQLEDCTFVRDTFTDISRNHCPGLKKYVKWIYIGLVMVSVAVMLSLVFWVLYARERRHRVYTKQHMKGYGHGPSEEGYPIRYHDHFVTRFLRGLGEENQKLTIRTSTLDPSSNSTTTHPFQMDSSAASRYGRHVGYFESNNSSKGKIKQKQKDTPVCIETEEEEYLPLSEGKPYMLFIMAHYHVQTPYQLVLPTKIHSLLPDARVPVVLKCRKKKWLTSFHGDGNKRIDVSGWRIFAMENNLKEGDGCVFEMTKWSSKMIVFEVQILDGDMPPELLERCQVGTSGAPIVIN